MPKSWRWDVFWCMAVAAAMTAMALASAHPAKDDGSDIIKMEVKPLYPPAHLNWEKV